MSLLGIDYGKKYIGVAIGTGQLAQGLTRLSYKEAVVRLIQICHKELVTHIVIGVPEGRMQSSIKQFGKILQQELKLPVVFWDETLSSYDAQELLHHSGGSRKNNKQKEHQTAAALILQSYIDSQK